MYLLALVCIINQCLILNNNIDRLINAYWLITLHTFIWSLVLIGDILLTYILLLKLYYVVWRVLYRRLIIATDVSSQVLLLWYIARNIIHYC